MRMLLVCTLLLAACTQRLQVGDLTGDGGAPPDAPADVGNAGDAAAEGGPASACPAQQPQVGDPCSGTLCCQYGMLGSCCNITYAPATFHCLNGKFGKQINDVCMLPPGYVCPDGGMQLSWGFRCDPGPQKLFVSPTRLDFGCPVVGGDYGAGFGIANVGGATLTIQAIDVLEDHTTGAFSLINLPVPFTIGPGEVRSVGVGLRPNAPALPTGTIIIHSDDPDPNSATAHVGMLSHVCGTAALSVCAINSGPPPACTVDGAGVPLVDFGAVSCGATLERVVSLTDTGDGGPPIEITGVALAGPGASALGLGLFRLVDDPAHPGQKVEQAATLPFLLGVTPSDAGPPLPADELRVHLALTAPASAGALPSTSLVIQHSLSGSPTTVPTTAQVQCGPPDAGADQ